MERAWEVENFHGLMESAKCGQANSQYLVGVHYSRGRVVDVDRVEAYKWLTLAVEGGAVGFASSARDELAQSLTPSQRLEAGRLADEWRPDPDCATVYRYEGDTRYGPG